MRVLISILFTILIFASCQTKEKIDTITIPVKIGITEVNVAKYTNVYGEFVYLHRKFRINNGVSGYYYKKYKIKPGDTLFHFVKINVYKDSKNNKSFEVNSYLNLKDFEIKE